MPDGGFAGGAAALDQEWAAVPSPTARTVVRTRRRQARQTATVVDASPVRLNVNEVGYTGYVPLGLPQLQPVLIEDFVRQVPEVVSNNLVATTPAEWLVVAPPVTPRFPNVKVRILELFRANHTTGNRTTTKSALITALNVTYMMSFGTPTTWQGASPQVALSADGGYQFEWHNGARELFIACEPNGAMEILEVDGDTENEFQAGKDQVRLALGRFLRA